MSANPAELGIFIGTALLLAPLIPVWKMRMAQKNKKDVKKVFYEPTQLKMLFLYYIPAVCVLGILSIVPHAFPGYSDWIMSEIDRDTFWSGFIMILHMFIPLYGPAVIYGYYIYSRYDKVVHYESPEWNEYRKSLKESKGI